MSDREHLLSELDLNENRQRAIQIERAALNTEEQLLLARRIELRQALADIAIGVGDGATQ